MLQSVRGGSQKSVPVTVHQVILRKEPTEDYVRLATGFYFFYYSVFIIFPLHHLPLYLFVFMDWDDAQRFNKEVHWHVISK